MRGIGHMKGSIRKTKQSYCFLMPEETNNLIEFLLRGDDILYMDRSEFNEPARVFSVSLNMSSQIFISPVELGSKIIMQKIDSDMYYGDASMSPVIQFDASILGPRGLGRGRLYFRSGYYGRYGWVRFDDSLYKCFLRVNRHIRVYFTNREKVYGALVSKAAKGYVLNGGKLIQC